MNVTAYEKKEDNTAEMTVAVEPAVFDAAVDGVYKRMRGRISVPGFRKGKAPRKIIENAYGKSVFYDDAMDEVIPAAWAFGIKEKELRAVGYPRVSDVKVNDDLSVDISLVVDLYPAAEIGRYKGLEAVKPVVEVTESEVDAEIEAVRLRNARIETVDRPAINGDTVRIDYDGYLNGERFDGGKAEDYELTLGSNTFIYGFEQKIQGMTAGEERDLDLTFPDAYHSEELAGKDVVFKVKLHEVKSKILPELDDEFAKDVSEFDTVAEYRADVRARLEKDRNDAADAEFENNLLEKLAGEVQAEIPGAMFDEQTDVLLRNMANQLAQYGISLEQYFSMSGMGEAQARAQMRPQAERQVRVTLALEKVAELEGLEPTEEEIDAKYAELAERYGVEIEEIREEIERGSVVTDLRMQAAVKFVKENATAIDPPPEEPDAAPEESDAAPEEKPKPKRTRKKKTEELADETPETPADTAE